jgi:hypothetical protein
MVEFLPIPKGDDISKNLTAAPALDADKVQEMLAIWQKPGSIGSSSTTSGADVVQVDFRDNLTRNEQFDYDHMSRDQEFNYEHMTPNDRFDYRNLNRNEQFDYDHKSSTEQHEYLRMTPNERWDHDHGR